MKKLMKVITIVLMIPMLLTGCIYSNTEVIINENGSGSVKAVNGFDKNILNKLGKTYQDFTSRSNESYDITSSGKKYTVGTYEDKFTNDINDSGVATISNEMGLVSLNKIHGGFELKLELHDFISKEMSYDTRFPELKDISDKTLRGMKLKDLIAQDVDGLVLKVKFNMPYEVKQVSGGTSGVYVKGKTIQLDYLKMIKSGSREWKFESIKNPGKVDPNSTLFMDVKSSAWYAKAVLEVNSKGIMKGFGDGTFKPNGTLTMAELAKIASEVAGQSIPNNPEYWAMGHILFAQDTGLFFEKKTATAKNWNVPATREQTVYAISMAAGQQDVKEVSSDSISDWNQIDDRMKYMILYAYQAGIVGGNSNGKFEPKSKVTRAEVAQILSNIKRSKK
ncbi:S-layer homology domain-containing protein [Paenibacillus tundrae]